MPIDTKHPTYLCREDDWTDCRTAFEGQRAVKEAGVRYLPRLKGQTDEEYSAYKGRALFYSTTSKSVGALVGMAMDKPPEMVYPDKLKPYFEDRSGTQFYELFSSTVSELLLMARFGVFVDRPAAGGMPYITTYATEDIFNWSVDEEGNTVFVVLREFYYENDSSDKYVRVKKTRYRELELVDGRLQITVHEDNGNNAFAPGTSTTITNTGKVMDSIPFFCVNPSGLSIEPERPPMLDIVDINFSHYRTSADLEHGRHFTGLPTPYVTGADGDVKLHIGSLTAWIIPNHQAKVGFLEFTGQGLGSLEKAMEEKQSQLASMSARLIDNSSRGSEAAETVRLRYMSETASLRSIVRAAEALLNAVYNQIASMEGLGDNSVNISLYKDFLSSKITAAELKAWVEAYLSGGVSKEMLLHALKNGDALPPPGTPQGTIPDPPPPQPAKPASTTSSTPAQ
jgi:hypothetical protein